MTGCMSDKERYEKWKKERIERLKAENGWLNLAGLYWLEEGANTFGSDSSNSIVFPPQAAPFMGTIYLKDTVVSMKVTSNVEITGKGGNKITAMDLAPDITGKPDQLNYKDLRWFIIRRGNKFGIRLRNLDAPLLHELDSIPGFPFDQSWIIEARFEKFDNPHKVIVPTVIGVDEEYKATGRLVFSVNGNNLELIPFDEGDNGFFIIFADQTSAKETYGGGRFLYAPKPDRKGMVKIDFNRAYNPPCAFTPYATCPLPPRENILQVAVTAGEKAVHVYEH